HYPADHHRAHRSLYSAPRHTFLDALFRNVWRRRRLQRRRRLGWWRIRRWWRVWRIRRWQFRRRRGQQQLVASEDANGSGENNQRLCQPAASVGWSEPGERDPVWIGGSGRFSSRVLERKSVLRDSRQFIRGIAG